MNLTKTPENEFVTKCVRTANLRFSSGPKFLPKKVENSGFTIKTFLNLSLIHVCKGYFYLYFKFKVSKIFESCKLSNLLLNYHYKYIN